jgi:hypothetical protein
MMRDPLHYYVPRHRGNRVNVLTADAPGPLLVFAATIALGPTISARK